MALTEGQIIDALTILGLPVVTDAVQVMPWEANDPGLREAEKVRTALSKVNAEQQTRIEALIAQWTPIQYDTDLINAQGLDSAPERARQRMAKMLGNLIGYTPQPACQTIRIGRA